MDDLSSFSVSYTFVCFINAYNKGIFISVSLRANHQKRRGYDVAWTSESGRNAIAYNRGIRFESGSGLRTLPLRVNSLE